MFSMSEKVFSARILKLAVVSAVVMTVMFGLLPRVTRSVDVLRRMSLALEENGIDPSRYYYTDVEQVIESELYLRTVLGRE
jgi:hypothetical protein